MIRPQTRRNIYSIIPFGLIWMIFSLVYVLLEKGLLGELQIYPSTGNPYNFAANFPITVTSATISGLLVGTFEILYSSFGTKSV